jgi:hypothetical protein
MAGHRNSRLDERSSGRESVRMGLRLVPIGAALLVLAAGFFVFGCGQSMQAKPTDPEAGAGERGTSMQAGTAGAETRGGSGASGSAGRADFAGAAGDGIGGQGTLGGAAGQPAGGDSGVGENCSLVHHVEGHLPAQTTRDSLLVKSGLEFAVTDGLTLTALAWSGELARQQFDRNVCSNCDGLFGITPLRADAGWRLLSIDRADQGAAARAWRISDPSPPEYQPLFGPQFSGLVSSFALRPSRDGKRAVFANGHRTITQRLTFAALDADGRVLAEPSTLEVPFSLWDYLTVVPTEHAAAVSVIAESDDHQQRIWLLRELDSSGQLVFASQVSLPPGYGCLGSGSRACVIVEDADGYYLQLGGNTVATRIGRLLRDRPSELVIDEHLVPPGALVGTFAGMFVFLKGEYVGTTLHSHFVGLSKSGPAEPRTLAAIPAADRDFNPRVQLIALEGNSLFYGFQTPDSQVIEEVKCSIE